MSCLVQADPCSVGYGDGGKDFSERPNGACLFLTTANGGNLCATSGSGFTNGAGGPCPAARLSVGTTTAAAVTESVRIDQVYPNASAVLALGSQTTREYQIGRKLYFNSLIGFDAIADTSKDPGATGELALAEFEGVEANIAPILTGVGYFPLAGSNPTTGSDPAGVPFNAFNSPFCEDFYEPTVCNPATTASTLPANVNGCAGNAGAALEYSGAVALPTVGPLCGDGNIDPFEECDNGLSNGTSGNSCSTTCRCSGTTSFEQVGGTGAFGCH
jgi:hypothetical protein